MVKSLIGIFMLLAIGSASGAFPSLQKINDSLVASEALTMDGEGKIKLLAAEGKSVPGPTLQIGNTNSRYKFGISAREYIDRWSMAGPAHHSANGVGHVSNKIEKLAKLPGIECVKIC